MKSLALLLAVGFTAAAFTSCHDSGPQDAAAASEIPIPSDSPLAKIKSGMSKTDVEKILGAPTSTNSYIGGKAWNPFNFGGDSGARVEAHYKGLGIVIYSVQRFSMEMNVDELHYNPNESGQQPEEKK